MRGWLEKLVNDYLNRVADLSHSLEDRATAETLATAMRRAWAEQGLSALKQQKNLMTETRNAIRSRLGEGHIALETMNFSTHEWTEVNRATAGRVANQNSNQQILDPGTVNAVVTRATQLLQSREWSEIAAGLAVLTGRRSTEVLKTAQFEWKTEFSVTFVGALKRKGEEKVLSFEIPTLCQAEYVVTAWEKLRKILRTDELTNAQVNIYSDSVSAACDKHFADLVNPTEGRDKLYTHLFRKIYATIATYFYCPTNVDDAEFRAEIQGHFSGHEHLTLAERRSIASDRHYRSYVIQDENGNMRKGVRLDWQGVEVIEAFGTERNEEDETMIESVIETVIEPVAEVEAVFEAPAVEVEAVTEKEERKRSSLRIYSDDHDRWMLVLAAICPECNNQFDKTTALLDWAEEKLEGTDVPLRSVAPKKTKQAQLDISAIEHQARTLSWLTGEVESLREQLAELRGERDELRQQVNEVGNSAVEELKVENEELRQERDRAVSKLDVFRGLLDGNSTAVEIAPVTPSMTQPKQPKQTKRALEQVEQKLPTDTSKSVPERALEAIMAYNDRQENHTDKWVTSFPAMKDLCKQLGAATQGKINDVLQVNSTQIDKHHRAHGLGERHNRVHKGQSISEFIRL